MGRKGITINLKSSSPEGEVRTFTAIPEAARELGFSEVGVRKAYYTCIGRIGEYQLEWLELEVEPGEDPEVVERIKRYKERLGGRDCIYCNKKLDRKSRVSDGLSIVVLGKDGRPVQDRFIKSLFQAHKLTRLSLCSLINAAEKGNIKITRQKDKKEFIIRWGTIHENSFS